MPKLVMLYPKVDVYGIELDQFFSCVKDPGNDNKYLATVNIPSNVGEEEATYTFEAYSNDQPTGLLTYVIVGYETIYEKYPINCIHIDKDFLEYTGGQVSFLIEFNVCEAHPEFVIVPQPAGIKLMNKRLIGNDIYLSGGSTGTLGLWKFNWSTKEFDRIIDTGSTFTIQTFQHTSNLYAIDNSGAAYWINSPTGVQPLSFPNTIGKIWFEDSKGNIYICPSGSNTGLYAFKTTDHIISQVITVGSSSYAFFEDSKGNVYWSANILSTGLWLLNGTNTATQITSSSYGYFYFFEDSKGNVYCGSHVASTGLFVINGTSTPVKIITTGSSWQYFFEDSKGNTYVSSYTANGIYLINGTNTPVQVHTTGTMWTLFFEDSKKNVYVSSTSTTTLGLYYLNGNATAVQIYSKGNGWQYFFEDSKKNVYVGNNGYWSILDKGVLYLNGSANAVLIIDHSSYWRFFFEDSKGNVFLSAANNNVNIIYLLHKDQPAQIVLDDGFYDAEHYYSATTYFKEVGGRVYLALDVSAGLFVYDEYIEEFVKTSWASQIYSARKLGVCTYYGESYPEPGSLPKGTYIFYGNQLIFQTTEDFYYDINSGNIGIAESSDNILIVLPPAYPWPK